MSVEEAEEEIVLAVKVAEEEMQKQQEKATIFHEIFHYTHCNYVGIYLPPDVIAIKSMGSQSALSNATNVIRFRDYSHKYF